MHELRVVDLDSKTVKQIASLATHSVSVDSITSAPGPGRVFGASHSQSDFRLRPRIKRFELRFPHVRLGDTRLCTCRPCRRRRPALLDAGTVVPDRSLDETHGRILLRVRTN